MTKVFPNTTNCTSEVKTTIQRISEQIKSVVDANPNFYDNFKKYIRHWPEFHKSSWLEIAGYGWFINWETPVNVEVALSRGQDVLDLFMIQHLTHDWETITMKLLSLYPEREHILLEALKLHQDGKYVASIPLFMTQIDGICQQNLDTFLFCEGNERGKKIKQIVNESSDCLLNVFLEVLNAKTQFSSRISFSSQTEKKLAPNRHGILHGAREHLDYGNEINSFKAFSFLAFIAYCFNSKILNYQ